MPDRLFEINGITVLVCGPDGAPFRSERDGVDLVGEAFAQGAGLVAIPVERFDDAFFSLQTRMLGELIQKFVTYRIRLAIVGDIARYTEASVALRDFVRETNRGTQVWFVPDLDELDGKLR